RNQPSSHRVAGNEIVSIVDLPGLGVSEGVEVGLDRGLENRWELAGDPSNLVGTGLVTRPGTIDDRFIGELVSQPLVIGPTNDLPRWGGKPKMVSQHVVMPRQQGRRLIASRKE